MKPVAHFITVSNMTASLEFYSKVFGCEPAHVDDGYSWFDIDGFAFGLLNSAFAEGKIVYGNAAAMCFLVTDIDATYERLTSVVPVISPAVEDMPTIRVFKFQDHDGNLIEVFQRIQ